MSIVPTSSTVSPAAQKSSLGPVPASLHDLRPRYPALTPAHDDACRALAVAIIRQLFADVRSWDYRRSALAFLADPTQVKFWDELLALDDRLVHAAAQVLQGMPRVAPDAQLGLFLEQGL